MSSAFSDSTEVFVFLWLVSLSMCSQIPFTLSEMAWFPSFLWLNNVSFYMYYHIFLTPLIISRHLGCLPALAIMRKAAMNSFSWGMQIPLWDSHFTSLEYKPRHGISGSHGSFIFHFSGISLLFSIVAALIYILNKSVPCSSQQLLSPVLLMIAILTDVKWYLFMVWFSFLQGLVISSGHCSCSVMSDSLWPHGLQHANLPCPSPTLGAYSNSCPLSQWCHPIISSSVVPFSSCLQSFPVSGSFPLSQFFTSACQNIGVSASASVLPMNI